MAWFWWLLFVLILQWIAAIVDIIRKRHTRTVGKRTAAWILLILILRSSARSSTSS